MTEKIISKGFYTHPVTPNFVAPKQFMVLKKGKGSQLFIRFENPRNEILTAISFSVDCYDAEGRVVKTTKIEQHNLKVAAHSGFIANRPVSYDAGYADFKVTVSSAAYGDYLYVAHGDEIEVVYEKQDNAHEIDRTPFLQKLGGHTHRSFFRSLHTPKFFAVLLSLLVVSLFAVLGVKIYNFTRTEELFTLDMIEYTFASENRDGPIIILGTNSTAANIIVPDKIEGHDIVEVASGAFSKSKVRTIEFKGTINVAANAFSGSQKLQSVSFEAVETIGKNAFSNCKKLTEVVIGDGLATIGESAFDNCSALTTITLPSTVQSIGRSAFASCRSLTSLIIPDSTTYIGENILANCYAVSSLQTPFIGQSAKVNKTLKYFYGTATPSALKNLTVTKTNVIDNNLFNGEIHLETIAFTSSVTQIGDYAFYNCSALTTFNVPVTVESIGRNAFANCASLTSIAIPEKVTSISDNLFANCYALQTVTLPTTLTYVGASAFQDCRKLTSLNIPAGVTRIGSNALRNCVALTDLTLPFLGTSSDTLLTLADLIASGGSCNLTNLTLLSGTVIPEYAFSGFKNLAAVSLPTGITTIGANAFYGCNALKEVAIPATVSTVSDYAFSGCTSLKKMEIPSTVTSVGGYAFSGCTSLSEVTFSGDATEIGEGAFYYCSSLSYVNLPNNLTTLAMRTFERCTSLESVVLPAGIATIPDYTFYTCTALKSVSLPAALTTIGSYAFAYCQSLPLFEFPSTVQTINSAAFEGCTSLTSITIPDTIVNIGSSVFSGCSSVASITAPYPTEYSEGACFNYYFSSEYSLPSSLKRITVSRLNSQYLPSSAFYGCSYLEEINLPVGVTEIGSNAFYSCSALKTLTISSSLSLIEPYAFAYCQSLGSFEIASSVQYIGEGAFSGCSSLVSITIPDTVMSIGTSVFAGCSALVSMTAPYPSAYSANAAFDYYFASYSVPASLKNVTLSSVANNTLPSYAFENCYYIEEIRLPSTLTTIDQGAFSCCSSLKSITLPDEVSSISDYAFNYCTSLESIEYPAYTTTIPNYAFYNCTALKEIALHDDLTSIGDYAFGYCQSLESFDFGGSVQRIGNYAFEYCQSLQSFELGSSVQQIGSYAFSGCTAITSITIPETVSSVGWYAFSGCNAVESMTAPYPTDYYNDYYSTTRFDYYFSDYSVPTSLKYVTISRINSLSLPSNAFNSCSAIEQINLPDNLYSVGSYAFYNCSSLTSLVIPDNVSSIGSGALAGTTALTSITLPFAGSGQSSIYEGFHYLYGYSYIPSALETVTLTRARYIPYNCFENVSSLRRVELPETLEAIYNYAFYNCTSLNEIVLPSSLSYIDYDAFSYCTRLYEVTNFTGISNIAQYFPYAKRVFNADSEKLVDRIQVDGYTLVCDNNGVWYLTDYDHAIENHVLPSDVYRDSEVVSYYLPERIFQGNSNIKSISIPDNVIGVNAYAFYGCTNLATVSFADNSQLAEIQEYAFYSCSALSSVSFGSNSQLATIKEYAFSNSGIQSITLPASLSTLGECAFQNCYNLGSVAFSDGCLIESIPRYSFYGCTSLSTVSFGNSSQLAEIQEYAFYDAGIQTITFPNTLASIGGYSFSESDLVSIMLPSSLTSMGEYAFAYCYSLQNVSFDRDATLGAISNGAFYSSAVISATIPASVTSIGEYAFAYCGSLQSLSIGENSQLTEIQGYAFLNTGLINLMLPASLKTIGYSAFNNCSNLQNLTFEANSQLEAIGGSAFQNTGLINLALPASLKTIGDSAFNNCSNLQTLTFEEGSQLSAIGGYAFSYSGIQSLSFPALLETIGYHAFSYSAALSEVTFAADSMLSRISEYAFYNTAIQSIDLPEALTYVGYSAFSCCNSLTSVTLRSSSIYTEYDSFSGNSALQEVYNLAGLDIVPGSPNYGYVAANAIIVHTSENAESLHDVEVNGLYFKKSDDNWFLMGLASDNNPTELVLEGFTYNDTEVDSFIVYKRAFEGNTTLTSLTIGAAVSAIMPYAFSCCSNITSLTFDDDCVLTEIPAAAFEQCYNIRAVLLPDSVETIGERAFANCTRITAVLIPEHVSSIGNDAFIGCYNLYDVMDLSSIDIGKGSIDNGYVGYYALAIRNSSTPLAVTSITSDTYTAKFVKHGNAWYLIGFENNPTDGPVVLPELTVDDTTYNYRIFGCSMRDICETAYMLSILIGDNVAAIDNSALGYLANHRIYFDGTASEWNKLDKDGIISNVYLYADCIHEDGYWNYDENGAIVTTPVEFEVTEFVEPTCKDTGSRTLTCPLCEESVTEELAVTDEHDIVDNQCTVCGKVLPAPISVTSANFSTLDCISNNSSYPFAIDENGIITSQNRNNSSSSRLTITASTEMTVSFEYSVSSEGGWDHFRAYHNGTQIFDVSGSASYQSYSLTLAAGDTLEFEYSKDGSVSSGSDCGFIKNLVLAELQLVEP